MKNIIDRISKLHEEKLYRPVVITLIKDNDKYLIIQSAKGTKPWGLPQGGIEYLENPTNSLFREIFEELGIKKDELNIVKSFFHYNEEDAPKGRLDKRGFLKGKAYFFCFLSYHGDGNIILQEEEVADYRWCDLKEFMNLLKTARHEKQNMIKVALDKLGIL